MGFSGTGPGSAPAAIESAHNKAMGAKRFAVVQRQGAHTTQLGSYHDKSVAMAALGAMVAKGFARDELSVRRSRTRSHERVPWWRHPMGYQGSDEQRREAGNSAPPSRSIVGTTRTSDGSNSGCTH